MLNSAGTLYGVLGECRMEATVGTSIAHEQGVSPLFRLTSDYSRGTLLFTQQVSTDNVAYVLLRTVPGTLDVLVCERVEYR